MVCYGPVAEARPLHSSMLERVSDSEVQGLVKSMPLDGGICQVPGVRTENRRDSFPLPSVEEALIKPVRPGNVRPAVSRPPV